LQVLCIFTVTVKCRHPRPLSSNEYVEVELELDNKIVHPHNWSQHMDYKL